MRSLLAVPFLLVLPAVAHAEAAVASGCFANVHPQPMDTIPPNAPALVVDINGSGGTPAILSATVTAGTTPPSIAVMPDPRSKAMLLVPNAPLDANAMQNLSIDLDCKPVAGYPRMSTFTFETGATTPLPTTMGTLAVSGMDSSATLVTFKPSAELAAYLPVAMFTGTFDGANAGELPYGVLAGSTIELRVSSYGVGTSLANLCGTEHDVTKSTVFSLSTHVAGATTDPPAISLPISVRCPPTPKEPVPTQKSGGCSTAPGEVGWPLGIGIALALLGLRKRNRC